MSLNDARRFVAKMREDLSFRKKALDATGPEDLASFQQSEGLLFDQKELVGAMAECMAQLEQQMGR
jgi:predicted ribosomally synthesized peptide with nif11-like leader